MQDVFRNVWKPPNLLFASVMVWSGLSGHQRSVNTPKLMMLISSTIRPALMLTPLTTRSQTLKRKPLNSAILCMTFLKDNPYFGFPLSQTI